MIQKFRIGNYINDYEVNEGYFKIEEIKDNGQGNLAVYYRKGSCMSINPEPIPLTEELLLNCGFRKNDNQFKRLGFSVFLYKDADFYESYELPMFIHLQFLHQLQNLYYALTNEELTINL